MDGGVGGALAAAAPCVRRAAHQLPPLSRHAAHPSHCPPLARPPPAPSHTADRVDRLRPEEQLTLKAASVLGLTVYAQLLQATHPQRPPPAALEASLCALEAAAFLRQDPLEPATWRFCQVRARAARGGRGGERGAGRRRLQRTTGSSAARPCSVLPAVPLSSPINRGSPRPPSCAPQRSWPLTEHRPPDTPRPTPPPRSWPATSCTSWCPRRRAATGTPPPPPPWRPTPRVGGWAGLVGARACGRACEGTRPLTLRAAPEGAAASLASTSPIRRARRRRPDPPARQHHRVALGAELQGRGGAAGGRGQACSELACAGRDACRYPAPKMPEPPITNPPSAPLSPGGHCARSPAVAAQSARGGLVAARRGVCAGQRRLRRRAAADAKSAGARAG